MAEAKNQLARFERDLGAIVGEDLARDLVLFGRATSPLEAQLLTSDGFDALSRETRRTVLELIDRYLENGPPSD